jgi:hypothetical protein
MMLALDPGMAPTDTTCPYCSKQITLTNDRYARHFLPVETIYGRKVLCPAQRRSVSEIESGLLNRTESYASFVSRNTKR